MNWWTNGGQERLFSTIAILLPGTSQCRRGIRNREYTGDVVYGAGCVRANHNLYCKRELLHRTMRRLVREQGALFRDALEARSSERRPGWRRFASG